MKYFALLELKFIFVTIFNAHMALKIYIKMNEEPKIYNHDELAYLA